jgi:hypothetical protein
MIGNETLQALVEVKLSYVLMSRVLKKSASLIQCTSKSIVVKTQDLV